MFRSQVANLWCLNSSSDTQETQDSSSAQLPTIGIGLDCAVIPLRNSLSLVQTTDFLYPLIDDPYLMGKVACANVLSDLYAMGVSDCDNMLVIVGVSTNMKDSERDVVYNLMMKGYSDHAKKAGSRVRGGGINLNEWCVIGGVATAVCLPHEISLPNAAEEGDLIVLTKPLGTQNATFGYQWLQDGGPNWEKIKNVLTEDEIKLAYFTAVDSMIRLNRTGARLMRLLGAHAATDVTGFGLLGHARNLAEHQLNDVLFKLHSLPIIANMAKLEEAVDRRFRLMSGEGIETSGGLLICFPREKAAEFCSLIESEEGYKAWVVGQVTLGLKSAVVTENPNIIEAC